MMCLFILHKSCISKPKEIPHWDNKTVEEKIKTHKKKRFGETYEFKEKVKILLK